MPVDVLDMYIGIWHGWKATFPCICLRSIASQVTGVLPGIWFSICRGGAWCSADMHGEIPCFDFRTCATWRRHVYSSDEMNRKVQTPFFQSPWFEQPVHLLGCFVG